MVKKMPPVGLRLGTLAMMMATQTQTGIGIASQMRSRLVQTAEGQATQGMQAKSLQLQEPGEKRRVYLGLQTKELPWG